MRQPPIFDFATRAGDELEKDDARRLRKHDLDEEGPAFEPTRDGWRAYEAWCKQIRAEWDTDS